MPKTAQKGLRLSPDEAMDLKRVAEEEGRSEPEVARESIRMYIRMHDEHKEFVDSVERGWYQLRTGLGKSEEEHDGFMASLEKEMSE